MAPIVRGIIVRSRSIVGNIGAALQTIVGGNISIYTNLCERARQDAFEACQYAIDTIKRIVPIWKRELFEDGSAWVGLQGESPPPGWSAGDGR